MNSRNTITLFFLLFALSSLLYAPSSEAMVTGLCVSCHTMHNSQGGTAMAIDDSWDTASPPYGSLLIYSCIGCHSAIGGNTWQDSITKAPIVFNTSAPQYGASSDGGTTHQGLAGGNFYWVQTEDTKGHNIFATNPDTLTKAPGDYGLSTSCGTDNCHANFHLAVSGSIEDKYKGKQGCTKCHMVNTAGPKGFHHKNDGTGTKYVTSAAQGWYRFLEGHMSGVDGGVAGIEHERWNYDATASSHNEYAGYERSGAYSGFWGLCGRPKSDGCAMTAYCTGCHMEYHDVQGIASPWLRHPSDAVIPVEYASISTTYNLNVPVARPIGSFSWSGGTSGTVAAGTDMVMCLSCHRAHGSPYFKMMRWDYKGWPGSGGTNGCNVCHTSKN